MTARGIRNNNPGNIRRSNEKWQGLAPHQEDTEFFTFITMAWGVRAMLVLLKNYRIKYGLTTVQEIISRWAPTSENDTQAYINAVCDGWVRPHEELPDTPETYLFLAQRIARHENGADARQITAEDWRAGLTLAGFQPVDTSVPQPTPDPLPEQPKEKGIMAIPAMVIAAAQALLPTVIDLFRNHGSKTAMRNADIIEKAGPTMVEMAKVVTGEQGVAEAVTAILDNPEKMSEFRAAVQMDLDKLVGMIERMTRIDDESRDRAAERAAKAQYDFAPVLIKNQFYLLGSLAAATVIAFMLAIYFKAENEILVGLMVLFTGLVNSTATKWGTMIEYRFGSSSGSQAKDVIIAESRK